MYKITLTIVFLLLFFSCTKNEYNAEKDEFFYFKSVVGGTPYETFGYKYTDNSNPGGPQITIRRVNGDSLFVTVLVVDVAGGFNKPLQVGNIKAYFDLAKKGLGLEGNYSLNKPYESFVTTGGSPMDVDTTSSFNFNIADTSIAPFYGTSASGTFNFTLLKSGVKTNATGTFRLKMTP